MLNSIMQLNDNPYSLEKALQLRQSRPEIITSFQLDRLKSHLRQAQTVPYYRQIFESAQFEPESITGLDDLAKLPFTSRHDIDQYPQLFGTQDNSSTSDISMTSGTTGSPVIVPYTDNDLLRLGFNEMIGFYGAGIRKGDKVLLTVTIDRCFIAGLAYYLGLLQLGASAIRSGPGQPERQWKIISTLKPSAIVGVPSFLLHLARWGEKEGYDVKNSSIQKLVTIGEPVRKHDNSITPLGEQLEESWNAPIFSSYGATELETAFVECNKFCGGHIHPELMIAEIIDDEGKPVPPCERGEIVVTPLGVEGFPLVRFRTGDVARLYTDPCQCGWNTPRLGSIEGRLAQRLKVKGTTLYPETIFQTLQEIPETAEAYVEVRSRFDLSDEITIHVGHAGSPPDLQAIIDKLQASLRIRPAVIIKPREEILSVMTHGGGRKPQKFFDLR